ncbi:MAG: hypothetical protein LBL90_00365 [Prevotellaceae bacterium]|nr:hypothetical protein [Prevotellaceae bacterium]
MLSLAYGRFVKHLNLLPGAFRHLSEIIVQDSPALVSESTHGAGSMPVMIC